MDRRIRVPKHHEQLVDRLLLSSEDYSGPFRTKADIMAFAAALGSTNGEPLPFTETAGDPIRQEVFAKSGYETLIDLLAISKTSNPNILASNDQKEEERVSIFEGYANRGLFVLHRHLQGEVNYLDGLYLLILREKGATSSSSDLINISELLD